MDLNIVLLAGKLAAPPEVRRFESGTTLVRSLVTVRAESPRRRVDVVPVTLWDPGPEHGLLQAAVGDAIWVTGAVQRRFWTADEGRKSRLEIVAAHVQLHDNGHPDFRSATAGIFEGQAGPRVE